jgi:hypothetical protein
MKSSRTRSACLGIALVLLALAAPALADPQSDANALFNQTNAVAGANDFSQGERVSLVTKLIGTLESLERGHENTATNNLGAFINEVEALERSGRIPSADAEALITAAQAIIDQL